MTSFDFQHSYTFGPNSPSPNVDVRGEFVDGKFHGQGSLTWKAGHTYTGALRII